MSLLTSKAVTLEILIVLDMDNKVNMNNNLKWEKKMYIDERSFSNFLIYY